MARYATAEERTQRRAEAREAEARYRRGESTYAEWQKTRHESRPVATEVWALLSERGLGYKQGQEEPTNADIWAAYDELGMEWTWVVSAIDRTPAEARAIEAIEDTEIPTEDIEKAVVEAVEAEMATEEQTQAQKWEQDPRAEVREAWQTVWETVRAGRIGGLTQDWVYTDDAWLLAAEFATEILGEMDEPTAEWEELVDQCLAEIGRLL